MSETIIYCEGPYDRSFWDGWLQHLGCKSLRPKPGGNRPVDPFGEEVKGGEFAFESASGKFLRIIPCGGKDNIRGLVKARLRLRLPKPIVRMVLNVDADTNADGTPATGKTLSRQSIETLLQQLSIPFIVAPEGFIIDDGAAEINLIRWAVDDAHCPELPSQQTLERLACAAICAAHKGRGKCVQDWLASTFKMSGINAGVKEFALSHMAGWYAEQGCDAFYKCLWDDPAIAHELTQRLQKSGAWHIAETLAI